MNKNDILKEVLNEILPIVKQRIFKDGLATDMSKIGKSKRTRQYVDLVNTGALRNDLQVLEINGKFGIGVTQELSKEKAIDNEKRFKKKIFSLTKDEKMLVKILLQKRIKTYYQKLLQ